MIAVALIHGPSCLFSIAVLAVLAVLAVEREAPRGGTLRLVIPRHVVPWSNGVAVLATTFRLTLTVKCQRVRRPGGHD